MFSFCSFMSLEILGTFFSSEESACGIKVSFYDFYPLQNSATTTTTTTREQILLLLNNGSLNRCTISKTSYLRIRELLVFNLRANKNYRRCSCSPSHKTPHDYTKDQAFPVTQLYVKCSFNFDTKW